MKKFKTAPLKPNKGGEMRGFFIAFEGIDGCGKFTQLHKTKAWLEKLSFLTAWSREPNDISSLIGKAIKEMLQGERFKPKNPFEFQRLYVLDRAQDLFVFIDPWLSRTNSVFLMERFALSTIAYGMLSGKPAQVFIDLHEEVIGPRMIWPDLNIVLDVSAEETIKRISSDSNRTQKELFEKLETLAKVRQNYLSLTDFPKFKDSTVVINSERTTDEVFEDVKTVIKSRISAYKNWPEPAIHT